MCQSVPPRLSALVAPHKPCHWFIGCPDLLHVLAEGLGLMAKLALLAGVLINFLPHLVIKPSSILLQL